MLGFTLGTLPWWGACYRNWSFFFLLGLVVRVSIASRCIGWWDFVCLVSGSSNTYITAAFVEGCASSSLLYTLGAQLGDLSGGFWVVLIRGVVVAVVEDVASAIMSSKHFFSSADFITLVAFTLSYASISSWLSSDCSSVKTLALPLVGNIATDGFSSGSSSISSLLALMMCFFLSLEGTIGGASSFFANDSSYVLYSSSVSSCSFSFSSFSFLTRGGSFSNYGSSSLFAVELSVGASLSDSG